MGFSLKKYLKSLAIISIIVPLMWYGYVGYWQFTTKRLFKKAESEFLIMYAYEFDSDGIFQTLIGENEEEGRKLSEYYHKLYFEFKGIERERLIKGSDTLYIYPVQIPIQIKYVGVKTPLYVKMSDLESEVVKAYVFNTDCWGYFIAYIPSVNIHESEPPAELYDKFLEYVERLPKSTSRKFGSLSPYGFYCN
ncbi:hypothetical protein [Lunatimonas salinarum]|uniref:hypothetical protein n=1 Tax=Lunatimonas salinarum TaxID=1774590 RepID=UPI001AE04583|nr:hypothetical protein [Lunatimonas salinarum]